MHFIKTGISKKLKKAVAFALAGTLCATSFSTTASAADIAKETKDSSFYASKDWEDTIDSLKARALDATMGLSGEDVVIVIDPGHDDKHIGAKGYYSDGSLAWEQDLNFKIAKACYDALKNFPNVKVYMTREGGACGSDAATTAACLTNRVKKAESLNCDLFVSFHLNASKGATRGVEVYYPNQNWHNVASDTGKTVAKTVLEALTGLGLANRGIKYKNATSDTYPDGGIMDYLSVIKNSKLAGFPAILIEHAFMDNREDFDEFLSTDEKLRALGEADAYAIAVNISNIKTGALTPPTRTEVTEPEKVEPNFTTTIFDANYYWENNPDLQGTYKKYDFDNLYEHFNKKGKKEGRPSSPTFDIRSYVFANPDLRENYKSDLAKYYDHYEKTGQKEGRTCLGVTNMEGATTTYKGINYAGVYEFGHYVFNNGEETLKYVADDAAAIKHFVTTGMKKGLKSSSFFDVKSYYYANSDLRVAFGKDWPKYFAHYISHGKAEGRVCYDVYDFTDGATLRDGVDYRPVYDYAQYLELNPDIKAAYGVDEINVLKHFVTLGMKEGRKARNDFDVQVYMSKYPDLKAVFGNDVVAYFKHYMTLGKKEGRTGIIDPVKETTPTEPEKKVLDESTFTTIMGTTHEGCTVNAMAAYFLYNNKEGYPTYYADYNTGAPTIYDFCQIYLEECAAEGVRAEIAFTQAMKETNYLKYTGSVPIEKLNFAGIGAMDENTAGAATFPDVRTGIRAHIQHLKVYATKDAGLYYPVVDPRYDVIKGTQREGACIYAEYLGAKENPSGYGWATRENYGVDLMASIRKWITGYGYYRY